MNVRLYKNDHQEGPYDLPTIQRGLIDGRFTPDDLAWADGSSDWVPLRHLIQASKDGSAPTPAPAAPADEPSPTPETETTTYTIDPAHLHLLADEQDPLIVAKVLEKTLGLLALGETIEYLAVQKKHLLALAPQSVLITNKRYMIVQPKLMGMNFEDHAWRDIANVHLSEHGKTSTLTCTLAGGRPLIVDNIPPKQASHIYAYAQAMDEQLLKERRQRLLDEKRAVASAGAPVTPVPAYLPPGHTPAADDPLVVLTKLKKMLDAGLIETAEYDSKKREILSRM